MLRGVSFVFTFSSSLQRRSFLFPAFSFKSFPDKFTCPQWAMAKSWKDKSCPHPCNITAVNPFFLDIRAGCVFRLSACVQQEEMWALHLITGRAFQRCKWKGRHQLLLYGHAWVCYFSFIFFFKQLWWWWTNNDSCGSFSLPLLTLWGWLKEGAGTTLVSRNNKFY